jgi:acyl carrier protein
VYEELRTILVEDLQLREADVRPDAGKEGAGLDSLALVELSMILSKRFAIEISDDELMRVSTVAEIARLMAERSARA